MPKAVDPSLNRRKLRIALKKARDAAGLTQRQAADNLEWSLSKIIRIEAGTVSLSVTDLRAMLQEYGVTDSDTVSDLEEAARGSKGQSWWVSYSDIINPQFAQYLGYESAASTVRAYHPSLVPGLLQTSDYIHALFAAGAPVSQAGRNVDLRTDRQDRIFAEDGAAAAFIVDEAAVRRWIGGSSVMKQQLRLILSRMDEPRVSVRLLPFRAGAHTSLESSFVLLGFPDDEDVLYVSGPGGVLTNRDNRELVARYQECFEDLHSKALTEDETRALLNDLIEQYTTA
ncbi:helix-turn-helix domain-containing protein [Streptomyces aidingensis]|uniref:Helix-turn-helix domain-containing protein n=1 Tax=Streptomyces aidingensis TaxID=910347 RepID=A0A1I1M2L4_9ACTN|nr:helix-turn-helix transcriptional regulator [Streptomyces aidingensis]SFC78982.1 Helix-turn-helix domain-containing protein [Streptomyces aidingensis]